MFLDRNRPILPIIAYLRSGVIVRDVAHVVAWLVNDHAGATKWLPIVLVVLDERIIRLISRHLPPVVGLALVICSCTIRQPVI